MDNERQSPIGPVRRRRLLRAGGAAVAGVVGAGVAGAVAATPAQAAPGDPLYLGSNTNSGGATATTLTSSNQPDGTLVLGNTHTALDEFNDRYSGAPLVLLPHASQDVLYVDGPIGTLGVTPKGQIYSVDESGPTLVRTTNNTMELFATAPVRLLDTRYPEYRNNILNLDALNPALGYKLRGGAALHLDLSEYLNFGAAVFATFTVVGADKGGYLVAYPFGGNLPNSSTVNFVPAEAISCLGLVKIGYGKIGDLTVDNAINLRSSQNCHVIVDVVGANTATSANIIPLGGAGVASVSRTAEAAQPKRSFTR